MVCRLVPQASHTGTVIPLCWVHHTRHVTAFQHNAASSKFVFSTHHSSLKALALQVNCAASGPITVRIIQLTAVTNGYIKLTLLNVAGSNSISSVAVAPTGTQV